jgi:protoporphyrinogen oxidase
MGFTGGLIPAMPTGTRVGYYLMATDSAGQSSTNPANAPDDLFIYTVSEGTGGAWSVQLSDGSVIEGDAVILATESWAAEPLIRPLDAAIADALAAIPTSSSATVSIAFNEEEIGFDLNAFGVLCPLVEGRALMAATYSSTKWPGRAPVGKVLPWLLMTLLKFSTILAI